MGRDSWEDVPGGRLRQLTEEARDILAKYDVPIEDVIRITDIIEEAGIGSNCLVPEETEEEFIRLAKQAEQELLENEKKGSDRK